MSNTVPDFLTGGTLHCMGLHAFFPTLTTHMAIQVPIHYRPNHGKVSLRNCLKMSMIRIAFTLTIPSQKRVKLCPVPMDVSHVGKLNGGFI